MKRHANRFERRRSWAGFCFVLPFIIGLLIFFLKPFIESMYYSVATLTVNYEAGFQTKFEGLRYYRQMFKNDPEFLLNFQGVMTSLLYRVPTVVVFSTFAALILNRQFKGRMFFRAIFFLPVIVMSGAVSTLIRTDSTAMTMLGDRSKGLNMIDLTVLQDLLQNSSLGSGIVNFLTQAVNSLVETSWLSGVQILLLLAALQNISPSLYEVARIEGANGWTEFWKITFPMCVPMIFLIMVYTVIDFFTTSENSVVQLISKTAFLNSNYSYASAMSVVYSLAIFLIIGLILLLGRNQLMGKNKD